MPHLLDKKNVDMLTSHKVFTVAELNSRCEIMLENYCKAVSIEASTMIEMSKTDISPAIAKYTAKLAKAIKNKKLADSSIPCSYETSVLKKLSMLNDNIAIKTEELESILASLSDYTDIGKESFAIRDSLIPKMEEVRNLCDEAETCTAKEFWPYPSYGDILFSVK